MAEKKRELLRYRRNRTLWVISQNPGISYSNLVEISQLAELDIALLRAKVSLAKAIFIDVELIFTKENCLIKSCAEDLLNLAIIEQAFLIHREVAAVVLCASRDIRNALGIEEGDLGGLSDKELKVRIENYRRAISK